MATNKSQEEAKPIEIKDLPKDEPATPESIADMMSGKVLRFCINRVPMPDVRRMINEDANKWVKGLEPEQQKELSRLLREKFERMRQFMEASHQEIISVTSQIGW